MNTFYKTTVYQHYVRTGLKCIAMILNRDRVGVFNDMTSFCSNLRRIVGLIYTLFCVCILCYI